MDRTGFKQFLNSAAREFDVALMSQISDLQARRGARPRALRRRRRAPSPRAPSPRRVFTSSPLPRARPSHPLPAFPLARVGARSRA